MHASRFILHLAPVTLLLTACNSTAPLPSQRISLSATIGSAGAPAASGPAMDVIVSGTNGKVRITSAQVVLSHIELASDAACTTDANADANDANDATDPPGQPGASEPDAENNDEHDCGVEVDPVLVNLPMDGTTKVILDALVPAGSYSGLRAKLEAVEGDDAGASAFLTAHPDFADVSVKVVGVFTDAGGTDHPFTFTSHVEAELAMNFASPVTVGASTNTLTAWPLPTAFGSFTTGVTYNSTPDGIEVNSAAKSVWFDETAEDTWNDRYNRWESTGSTNVLLWTWLIPEQRVLIITCFAKDDPE